MDHERVATVDISKLDEELEVTDLSKSDLYENEMRVLVRFLQVEQAECLGA